jgi:hypothetical protein
MNVRKKLLTIVSCVSFISLNALAIEDNAGKHLVLNLIGTGYMYESTVPDIDGDGIDDPAICFDVNVFDTNNDKILGAGTDCLSNIQPVGTGLALVGTSIFNLSGGTLMTRGNTTVQPVLQQTITSAGQRITHITGAAGTGNAILAGSGRFKHATGSARLSGMVDMSSFGGDVGDPITFDCLLVINMD